MNRKALFAVIGVAVLVGGVGVTFAANQDRTTTADPDVSKQQATQIAANHTGGTAQTAELEQEDGLIWEVTVQQANNTTQEVDVDGTSGDVLEVETEDEDEANETEDDSDGMSDVLENENDDENDDANESERENESDDDGNSTADE